MAFNKKRLILPERIEKKNPESQSDFCVFLRFSMERKV